PVAPVTRIIAVSLSVGFANTRNYVGREAGQSITQTLNFLPIRPRNRLSRRRATMDALSYLLQTVRLHTAVYATVRLRPPWGVRLPRTAAAAFHAVVHGRCWLRLEDADALTALGQGDVVVLPHGHEHTFLDEPGSPVRSIDPVTTSGPHPDLARQ